MQWLNFIEKMKYSFLWFLLQYKLLSCGYAKLSNSQWEVCVQVGSCCLNKYTIFCLYLLKCTSLSPWENSFCFFLSVGTFTYTSLRTNTKKTLFNQHFAIKLGVRLCLCKTIFIIDTRCHTVKIL